MKKVISILVGILRYLFFAVCIFGLIFSLFAHRKNEGAVDIFGKQLRIVVSNSMEKCAQTDTSGYKIEDIPVNALVVIEKVPQKEAAAQAWYADLKVGDVLTFCYVYVKQVTITHRIIEIIPQEGGYIFRLQGDNRAASGTASIQEIDSTQADSPNYIIGKVKKVCPTAGQLLRVLKEPQGLVCIIIIPCLLIMCFEIFRLKWQSAEKKRLEERLRHLEVERMKRDLEQYKYKYKMDK